MTSPRETVNCRGPTNPATRRPREASSARAPTPRRASSNATTGRTWRDQSRRDRRAVARHEGVSKPHCRSPLAGQPAAPPRSFPRQRRSRRSDRPMGRAAASATPDRNRRPTLENRRPTQPPRRSARPSASDKPTGPRRRTRRSGHTASHPTPRSQSYPDYRRAPPSTNHQPPSASVTAAARLLLRPRRQPKRSRGLVAACATLQ
jgi:hypothetical protein